MVLVQHHGQVGVGFHGGQHHVAQVGLARVLASAGRGLQDHRSGPAQATGADSAMP